MGHIGMRVEERFRVLGLGLVVYGKLSNLWSSFWVPVIIRPLIFQTFGVPKSDKHPRQPCIRFSIKGVDLLDCVFRGCVGLF